MTDYQFVNRFPRVGPRGWAAGQSAAPGRAAIGISRLSERQEAVVERVTFDRDQRLIPLEREGENMRPVTWVRVKEVRSGQWGIGGNTPSADDIKAMAAG